MNTQFARLFLLVFFLIGYVHAQDLYQPLPGAIPLQYGGYPATDLVLDGEILLPEDAHNYYVDMNRNTRGAWTLAELMPEENSVWKNTLSREINLKDDELPFKDQLDEVAFVSYAVTRTENYRFTVSKDHSFYLAYMGPKVHNFLLRKNLLRKLGYRVPPVKYLKSLKVEFKTALDRDKFIADFMLNVSRDTDRWITSAPEGANYFWAQDLIIMEDQNSIPNLSIGYLSEEIMDGRRIFNSLLVPYALTDMPESINSFSWGHGRIFSENVLLPYEHGDLFSPSHDDAIWMVKRILALTEKDWSEIADNCYVPGPVANLLYEKLKARRNNLMTLFRLKGKKLEVNSKYSDNDGVVKDGKLEQEFFDGYGRRFKKPDPESPLSYGEMSSLVKSKLLTQGIELAIGALNSTKYTGTDISGKVSDINNQIADTAEQALKDGKPLKGLAEAYSFPTISGRVIVSREIVAGSYIGSEADPVQLVDTIGISVSAGMFSGVGGVFAKIGQYSPSLKGNSYVPVSLSGSANASFTRTYSHVKPVKHMKKALKEPFKNLLVPFVKKEQSKVLKAESERDYDAINALVGKAQDDEYEKIYTAISQKLEVGESMIITDSISLGASAEAGVSLYGIVNVRGKVGGSSLVVSRLHLLRKSKTVVQVYKDSGNNNGYEVTLGLDQFIPIVKVSNKGSKGFAKTKFYNVRLVPGAKEFKSNLAALAGVFKNNSLEPLNKLQKPFVIKHAFTEQNSGIGILVARANKINSVDKINITSPDGAEKNFLRRYKGHTIGRDYEGFTQDLISTLTAKLANTQFSQSGMSSNNPGYTFHGKAFNKIQIFEGELDPEGKLLKPYSRLTRIWNGWRVNQEKAIKILRKIKDRYKFNFMPEEVLAQTKKIFLYNFSVNLYIHKEGIQSLVDKDEKAMKEIFLKYQSRDMTNYTGDDALTNSGLKRILRWKKNYAKAVAKNDLKDASNELLKIISMIERKLTIEGYEAVFGGRTNFLIMAKIDGFRIGDEDGDIPVESNAFGMIGNDSLTGPTSEILEFFRYTGSEAMTDGEFYVNWMMGRLI